MKWLRKFSDGLFDKKRIYNIESCMSKNGEKIKNFKQFSPILVELGYKNRENISYAQEASLNE